MSDRDQLDWIKKYEPWRIPKEVDSTAGPIQVVEVVEEDTWFQELVDIKGIGVETAKDIVDIYPTKEELIEDLKSGTHVPLNNKHVTILREVYSIK